METKAYRIVDWQSHYENNRTRDMKIMAWVPVPVKHDGYGYCRLVAELGAAGLGAWLAILQTAAKSHPRGTLLRDAFTPHDAGSISITTRLDKTIIQKTIDLCCSSDIKWIEVVERQGDMFVHSEIPHHPAAIPHDPARKGMEGNGIEEKGNTHPQTGGVCDVASESKSQNQEQQEGLKLPIEGGIKVYDNPSKSAKFQKPTAIQVAEYGKSIGFNIDGGEFVDFYTSKGWLVGKTPMKDWKACVRTWKKSHEKQFPPQKSAKRIFDETERKFQEAIS